MISKGYQTELLTDLKKDGSKTFFLILNWFLCCLGICGMLLKLGMELVRKLEAENFPWCSLNCIPCLHVVLLLFFEKERSWNMFLHFPKSELVVLDLKFTIQSFPSAYADMR